MAEVVVVGTWLESLGGVEGELGGCAGGGTVVIAFGETGEGGGAWRGNLDGIRRARQLFSGLLLDTGGVRRYSRL